MTIWQTVIRSIYNYTFKKESDLEHYYNNKYPKSAKLYSGRALPDGEKLKIDVRNFYTPIDVTLPKINHTLLNFDDIARTTLHYVHKNIEYTTDKTQVGLPEFWMFAFETMHTKKGDCEDGAILIANILLKSGIPYWRIRIMAGDVKIDSSTGGHAYCCYLSDKDNKWYVLDWCYYYTESNSWLSWQDAKRYTDVWFSFNTKYCFSNDKLDRENIDNGDNIND